MPLPWGEFFTLVDLFVMLKLIFPTEEAAARAAARFDLGLQLVEGP